MEILEKYGKYFSCLKGKMCLIFSDLFWSDDLVCFECICQFVLHWSCISIRLIDKFWAWWIRKRVRAAIFMWLSLVDIKRALNLHWKGAQNQNEHMRVWLCGGPEVAGLSDSVTDVMICAELYSFYLQRSLPMQAHDLSINPPHHWNSL